MSITRIYSVFCDGVQPDGQSCPQWVVETSGGTVEARRLARNYGWVRREGRDLCPDCKAGK